MAHCIRNLGSWHIELYAHIWILEGCGKSWCNARFPVEFDDAVNTMEISLIQTPSERKILDGDKCTSLRYEYEVYTAALIVVVPHHILPEVNFERYKIQAKLKWLSWFKKRFYASLNLRETSWGTKAWKYIVWLVIVRSKSNPRFICLIKVSE